MPRRQTIRKLAGLAHAFHTGLGDGLESGGEINCGMSYTCDDHQRAWDAGANLGEAVARRCPTLARILFNGLCS
jgi:hypothetical protein